MSQETAAVVAVSAEVGPGIYPGLTYAEYDQIRAINWSVLRKFRRSPAHARLQMTDPPEPTDEADTGNAFHRFVLQPEEFAKEYLVVPADAPGRRSNKDKEWWRQFEEENKGRTLLTAKELEELAAWRDGLYRSENVRTLLDDPDARRELTIVWKDSDTGLLCKGRIDLVSRALGATMVVDFKTAVDASDFGFRSAISRFGYAGQIMFYSDGLNVLAPMPKGSSRTPAFVPVEKTPPYCARVLSLGIASQEAARQQWRDFLKMYREAVEQNYWPGYPDGEIDLPKWALNE